MVINLLYAVLNQSAVVVVIITLYDDVGVIITLSAVAVVIITLYAHVVFNYYYVCYCSGQY